jgi:hypothetical protein
MPRTIDGDIWCRFTKIEFGEGTIFLRGRRYRAQVYVPVSYILGWRLQSIAGCGVVPFSPYCTVYEREHGRYLGTLYLPCRLWRLHYCSVAPLLSTPLLV